MWGYLVPLDQQYGKPLVLRKRNICPVPDGTEQDGNDVDQDEEEGSHVKSKSKGVASGGYLIGRHPECGKLLDVF